MYDIIKTLFENRDNKYYNFQIKLLPTVAKDSFIGVRTPVLKKLAKDLIKNNEHLKFLNILPHRYFEENQLHAFIISEIKEYDMVIELIHKFLPYVDNWATCDQLIPNIFKKNKEKLIYEIYRWLKSKHTYTIRFGIGMLMKHYLDDDFKHEYLDLASKVYSNEYYVNMMLAWYFATALAKRYDETIVYFENASLPAWVHNKAISKARDSYRISKIHKDYLKRLRIN